MKKILLLLLLLSVLLMTGCSSALLTSMFDSLDEMELPEDTDPEYEYKDMRIDLDDYSYDIVLDMNDLDGSHTETTKKYTSTGAYAFGFDKKKCKREDVSTLKIMYADYYNDITLYYYAGTSQTSGNLYQCVAKYNYRTKEYITILEDDSDEQDISQFQYAVYKQKFVFIFTGQIYRYLYDPYSEDNNDTAELFGKPEMLQELYDYASKDGYTYDEAICTNLAPLDNEFNNIMLVYMLYSKPEESKKAETPKSEPAPEVTTKPDLEQNKKTYFEMIQFDLPAENVETPPAVIETQVSETPPERYIVCSVDFSTHTGKLVSDCNIHSFLQIASLPDQNIAVFEEADNFFRIYKLGEEEPFQETYRSLQIDRLTTIEDKIIAYSIRGADIYHIADNKLVMETGLQFPVEYSGITNSIIYQKSFDDTYVATINGLIHFWYGARTRAGCYYGIFPGDKITSLAIGLEGVVEETSTLYSRLGYVISETMNERQPNFNDVAYARVFYVV